MKKILPFVLVLLLLPFGLKSATFPTRMRLGLTADSIVYFQGQDAAVVPATTGKVSNVDSVVNNWTMVDGYNNYGVYKVYWKGFSYPQGSSFPMQMRTQHQTTEILRLWGAYWPLRAKAKLTIKQDGVLIAEPQRADTVNYDTSIQCPAGKLTTVDLTILYSGTSGVSTTYSLNLRDTGTASGGTIPSIGPHICQVSLLVRTGSGLPLANQYVSCYLQNSGVKDSTGASIANTTFYDKTDANGIVKFNCIWSSYLIPNTKWVFKGQSPAVSQMRQIITVPRQTTYLISL